MPVTIDMMEDFRDRNDIWVEICALLKERIDLLHGMLESSPLKTKWGEDKDGRLVAKVRGIEFYQGAIEEVYNLLDAPNIIIEDLKQVKEREVDNE